MRVHHLANDIDYLKKIPHRGAMSFVGTVAKPDHLGKGVFCLMRQLISVQLQQKGV
jgi:hypothetical protein